MRVRWEDFGDSKNAKLKEDYLFEVQAKNIKVTINDYTTADQFECELDYKNFPFDPRCIRACGVVIAMEDTKKLFNQDNSLNHIAITPKNTIFIGFADEQSIKFDDTTRTVHLEGRDNTSLLIDRKFLKGTLNLQLPLDTIIQELLNELEQTRQIKVEKRLNEELPILAKFWNNQDELSGQKNTKKDESYWDVIQDLVSRAGLIAYIELDKLIITKPRSLYDPKQVKQFVYGKNLKSLEYKRKLGRRKNFNIVVRSLNLENKEILEALIPKEATAAWSEETGIGNIEVKVPDLDKQGKPIAESDLKPAPYISFRIPNVASKDHLIKIGQEIYEEIGRQQIEGSFETNEMRTSWTKSNDGRYVTEEFNILDLRIGTPVKIEIDQGDMKGLNKLSTRTDRERFLVVRGYSRKTAAALADTLSNPRLNGPLYTKSVSFTLDAENGFSCSVEFINFIQIGPDKVGG